jgi:hypothetical protein
VSRRQEVASYAEESAVFKKLPRQTSINLKERSAANGGRGHRLLSANESQSPTILRSAVRNSARLWQMLRYTAFAIVFMIVSIALPHMAASIAGGTIGLALSHAFESANVAQKIISAYHERAPDGIQQGRADRQR